MRHLLLLFGTEHLSGRLTRPRQSTQIAAANACRNAHDGVDLGHALDPATRHRLSGRSILATSPGPTSRLRGSPVGRPRLQMSWTRCQGRSVTFICRRGNPEWDANCWRELVLIGALAGRLITVAYHQVPVHEEENITQHQGRHQGPLSINPPTRTRLPFGCVIWRGTHAARLS